MKAIVVEEYGPVENLIAKQVPDPSGPGGRDLLVRCAVQASYTVASGVD